jgi:hypothetical protein
MIRNHGRHSPKQSTAAKNDHAGQQPPRLRSLRERVRSSIISGNIGVAIRQAFEHLRMKWRSGLRQLIQVPRSFLANPYQSGPMQVREMSKDRRLRKVQHSAEITDAPLPILDQIQNPQSSGISEGGRHQVDTIFEAAGILRSTCARGLDEIDVNAV